MIRIGIASLLLAASGNLGAEMTPLDIEEGAEFTRRVAGAAIGRRERVFFEALDAEGIAARVAGLEAWRGLTARQKERLRTLVREHFAATLTPSGAFPPGQARIAWSSARPDGEDTLLVDLGLQFGDKTLKTRWRVERVGEGWRIADIALSDPGISLARSAARVLGTSRPRRRDRREQARAEALPRLLGLAAIALVVIFASRRLSPSRRPLLYLTALAPALLFAIDGTLAVRRALSEPWVLPEAPPRDVWRHEQDLALAAQNDGRFEDAERRWRRAAARGAPPAPIAYQIGQAKRQRGDLTAARLEFDRALADPEPAPGAARELAVMALEKRENAEARELLGRYLDAAGPDPDTLSLLAVVEANLGQEEASLEAIAAARRMVEDASGGALLEARLRARAGDAKGTVAALRTRESREPVDRGALRSDPAYLPIATDPAWVAFLAEAPRTEAAPPSPTP